MTAPESTTSSGPPPGAAPLPTLARWSGERQHLLSFIQAELVAQHDFGSFRIYDKQDRTKFTYSKPSLFKPGAEKICGGLGWTPRFRRDQDAYEMAGSPAGLFAFVCLLRAPAPGGGWTVVGEGRGACHMQETRFKNANTAIKIALKRAMVDAVLRAAALSEIFTQDLEDSVDQEGEDAPPPTLVETPRERQIREIHEWATKMVGTAARDKMLDDSAKRRAKTLFRELSDEQLADFYTYVRGRYEVFQTQAREEG